MDYINEQLLTPILGKYDIIVCGGGVAGVAAAVAAGRLGADVLLIEKGVQLGGLATVGLISWYEPICNGLGRQLMTGMAEEMLKLSIRYGNDTLHEQWKAHPENTDCQPRYATFFSPAAFTMALDGFVLDSGAKILLDTAVVQPMMNEGRCTGVIVENKSGRGCYQADFFIDATGDGDLLARAGIPCVLGKNYLTYIAYQIDRETCARAAETGNLLHARKWVNAGSDLWGRGHPEDCPRYSGVKAEEVTDFVLRGRKNYFERFCSLGRTEADVTVLPGMAQFRTTRRLAGAYELTEADAGKHFEDSISVAGDFFKRGKCYEIPLRTLYHPGYSNMITAGRTISSAGWAWEVTRVIPVAVATGQAAGIAAALCAEKGSAIADLPVETLQTELKKQGVRLFL